jgi:hypothetical protein
MASDTAPDPAAGPARADADAPAAGRRRAERLPWLRDRAGAARPSWPPWRRSRPFWGGVLLILAGLELMVIPLSGVLGHGAIRLVIYIGIGGIFGVLIGVLLIACGVLLWLNPEHRTFYGIAGVVLGILSFPASNLGGFFLGMLLAIVGGSLAFAWVQVEQPQPATASRADAEPAGEQDDAEPATRPLEAISEPADAGPATRPMEAVRPRARGTHVQALPWLRRFGALRGRHQRRMALTAMPLVLAAGLLGSPGASATLAARQQTCILWILCFPGPSPTPAPSPSVSPSLGSLLPGGLLPGGGPASPTPSPSPGAPKQAPGAPGLVAATATSTITAGSATLDDFAFQGVTSLPTASGATVQTMKFTAASLTLSGGVTATVTEAAATTTTTSPELDFSGSVVLYATSLSGCLGPVCVTLTPSSVLTGLLKLLGPVTSRVSLTLTSVTTDQPLVTAGSLQAAALSISVS